jgi:hypothetical protein
VKPSGVRTSGKRNDHSPDEARLPKAFWAKSANFAKPTLITPIARAPHQNTSLGRQSWYDPHNTRERRTNMDFL